MTSNRRFARQVTLGALSALVAACAPHEPAGTAQAPRAAAVASAASPAGPTSQPGGRGYVSVALPMGDWLSLDRGLQQPEGIAAPNGVTPNLTYNLDEGVETLITDFGEQLARSAKADPSYDDCRRAAYSAADVVDVPRLPPGSWFCARDRSGRLAKLRIDGVDEEKAALRLAYKVWK